MRSKSNSIWQRAAMMTIIGTTLYGTAFASEAVLPKEAIPRLQLPTQETLLESKMNTKNFQSRRQADSSGDKSQSVICR